MYKKVGSLFGAEIGTMLDNGLFCIRVEAKPVIAAIIQTMGWYSIYVGPAQDSGRLWFLIPYTADIDRALTDLVDVAADVRQDRPGFGQLEMTL